MIKNIAVGATETPIYQRSDADNTEAMLLSVFFCNHSGSAVTLTIYIKEDSSVAGGDGNTLIKTQSIGAGDTYELDATDKLLLKGHTAAASRNAITAVASAAPAVTATVSVKEL